MPFCQKVAIMQETEVLRSISGKQEQYLSRRIAILFASLVLANIVFWIVSVCLYHAFAPQSLPLLLVAYTLGLRHAMDADHIAAIDNTTRRFLDLEDGRNKPVTLGLFFSLGHSSIVLIATGIVAAIANSITLDDSFSIIGSCISSAFLLLIGLANLMAAFSTYKQLQGPGLSQTAQTDNTNSSIPETSFQGGLFTWGFGKRIFGFVDKPWKMYFVGFLFGLGFDTAIEIMLLSIVVMDSSDSSWIVLCLAVLFTCGMTLIDSIDAVLMLKIYDWSAISNVQRLLFSLFITILSVIFAFGIAAINILEIIQSSNNLDGPFWRFIENASNSSESIGIFIVCCFIFSFLIAFAASCRYNFAADKEKTVI